MRLFPVLGLLLLLLLPHATHGQEAAPSPRAAPLGASAVAGTLGSAAGVLVFGAVGSALSSRCGVEDWGCEFSGPLLAGAVGGIVGSVAGTHLIARSYGAAPSVGTEILSATLGMLAGTLVGVGLMHALSPDDERLFLVGFTITQGTITAMGSRGSSRTVR